MEKIIAVVVMIAIVIGLIATAVMPMVSQMNAQGDTALQDLTVLSAGLQDGQVLGATVIQDYQINMSNIAAAIDPVGEKMTFTVINGSSTTLYVESTGTGAKNLAQLKKDVTDKSVYKKEVTYFPSGKIETLKYTLQAIN